MRMLPQSPWMVTFVGLKAVVVARVQILMCVVYRTAKVKWTLRRRRIPNAVPGTQIPPRAAAELVVVRADKGNREQVPKGPTKRAERKTNNSSSRVRLCASRRATAHLLGTSTRRKGLVRGRHGFVNSMAGWGSG